MTTARPAPAAPRRSPADEDGGEVGLPVAEAAALPAEAVLARLGSSAEGLSAAQVARRRAAAGPNWR
jgi:Mg2+-importing ATPase